MWKDLEETYAGKQILNRGFGGSQMSDLLCFMWTNWYLPIAPIRSLFTKGIMMYLLENRLRIIMKDARKLVRKIRKALPDSEIVFISAKPSIARWSLQEQYLTFNGKLEKYANRKPRIRYADVWTPMLDGNGKVLQDIFVEDDLHMNAKGYKIWRTTLESFLQ